MISTSCRSASAWAKLNVVVMVPPIPYTLWMRNEILMHYRTVGTHERLPARASEREHRPDGEVLVHVLAVRSVHELHHGGVAVGGGQGEPGGAVVEGTPLGEGEISEAHGRQRGTRVRQSLARGRSRGVPRPTYDEAVTVRSRSISHPAGLLYALLVLTVLAGILGMHALPSGPSPAIRSGHGHMAVTADAESGSAPAGLCAHTAGGADHLHHADRTCAAAGVGSPYTPPALSTAFSGSPVAAPWSASVPESALAARASPDLSELQLLRI